MFNKGFDDSSEREPGFDEDGNPVTIEAAQKFYHKGRVGPYMLEKIYKHPKDAKLQLNEGKLKVQGLLQQAKMHHLGQLSSELGQALSKDKKVADMPAIRVMKKKRAGPTFNMNYNPFDQDADRYNSRINYDQMQVRIQKIINGELKAKNQLDKKLSYEPVTEHHRFNPDQISMRHIVKKFGSPKLSIGSIDERQISIMTPNSSIGFSTTIKGPMTPLAPLNMPSIALPTPRQLSESRDYYTTPQNFSGSPRNVKDQIMWQLGGSSFVPDGGFRLSKASAQRNTITADSMR